MPTLILTDETPEELRGYERAVAFVAEMRRRGSQAPHGGAIDAREALALSKGQDFLRDALAAAMPAGVGDVGENRTALRPPDARLGETVAAGRDGDRGDRGHAVRAHVSGVWRGGGPADGVLGLEGGFTRRARRKICRVGVDDSFERGERTSRELAGWSVAAETIRRPCHAEAAECRKSERERLDVASNFGKAPGDWGLRADAGEVNTETGRRDVKVATSAVREPGQPCASEDYDRRDLPRPSVRHAIAGIETAELFGPRCEAEAERLGLTGVEKPTVLDDGAAWTWNPIRPADGWPGEGGDRGTEPSP